VNLDFAPVMDVVPPGTDALNQPIGTLHREYGHDPATVATHGTAFIRGMASAGVATTAKHFPGLGRVRGNTDDVAGVVDTVTTPNDQSLDPFRAAVGAGVPLVMVALATYTRIDPAHLAVFSPTVMRLLRYGMSFGGVIASDDLGAAVAVADLAPGQRAIDFLSAGGDLVVSKTVDATVAMTHAVMTRASRRSQRASTTRCATCYRRRPAPGYSPAPMGDMARWEPSDVHHAGTRSRARTCTRRPFGFQWFDQHVEVGRVASRGGHS
jgi:beta-N-acetylhexosaminidase